MENNENTIIGQEPEVEMAPEPTIPEAVEIAADAPIAEDTVAQAPVADVPLQPAAAPKKKGKGRKVLKVTLALVLVVAMIAGGCGITAYCLNTYWYDIMEDAYDHLSKLYARNNMLDVQLDTLDGQIDSLLSQIDNLNGEISALEALMNATNGGTGDSNSGSPNVSTQGLTPSQVYAKTIQSVVSIQCDITENGMSGVSAGSGFIISEDGYVVTNYHVVEGATKITVIDCYENQYSATLVGKDANNDLAVLKADATGLKPVTIGKSSDLIVGDQVVAIGNALGELSSSLSVGYVSSLDRIVSGDSSLLNTIQADISVNNGNSGGPLFNMKGEVVGIVTIKYSGSTSSGAMIEGIAFAIPTDDVIDKIWDIINYGYVTGAYLGVSVTEVDRDVANYYGLPMGVYVAQVVEGNCAQVAGVQVKDIITALGDNKVTGLNDLTRALQKFKAGDKTTITVWRGGQELILDITLDEKPQE